MRRRGSTMVEGALVLTSFVFLLLGVMDFGRLGFAYNSVTYAAHHAARFAATNGSASGHAATLATIQTNVQNNVVALDTTCLTVGVTWTPNKPGSGGGFLCLQTSSDSHIVDQRDAQEHFHRVHYAVEETNIRTPDVVEFAVSPQVGQPIFPARQKMRGEIRSLKFMA